MDSDGKKMHNHNTHNKVYMVFLLRLIDIRKTFIGEGKVSTNFDCFIPQGEMANLFNWEKNFLSNVVSAVQSLK